MKEVNKVTKIFKGFFGEELPDEVSEVRREKCNACSYNSKNSTNLSRMETLRNSFTGDFCTLCKCQIHEKTGSALEECALYMIGQEKKWYKLKLETMGKDNLNLLQTKEGLYDISIDGDSFLIDLGVIEDKDVIFEGWLEGNKDRKYDFRRLNITCGCTSSSYEKVSDNVAKIKLGLKHDSLSKGSGTKRVYMEYAIDGRVELQSIKLKYFKNE